MCDSTDPASDVQNILRLRDALVDLSLVLKDYQAEIDAENHGQTVLRAKELLNFVFQKKDTDAS